MDTKKIKMLRCLEIAKNAFGNTLSNPMVGALLAVDDMVIGEGFHQFFGGPHAEVNAINAVTDANLLKKSTLYVTLEPCSHQGKTPPCADLIIEKGIPRVIIGMVDPHSKVAGKGIGKLINAGVEVEVGLLEHECRELNKRFVTYHEQKRPFIILKWAETSDGFIDIIRKQPTDPKPNWITDELARVLVHKWRTEEMAILVGTNTALYDNPQLTSRDWSGHNPVRMVLDRKLRLPNNLAIFDNSAQTIIFTEQEKENTPNLKFERAIMGNHFPKWLSDYCYTNQINSIIVEGGSRLLQCFIDAGMWDEARVFKGDVSFGNGVAAPSLQAIPMHEESLKNSTLRIYQK